MSAEPLNLEEQLEVVITALEANAVPYALCGGLALAVHGVPRATKDIDVLVPEAHIETAMNCLATVGFVLRAGPIPLAVGTAHEQKLFRATRPETGAHVTVDILVVSQSYALAWNTAEQRVWKGHPLRLVSREGLISMKSLSTRLKDKADIEALENPEE